ncbi:MAG TPA: carbonic anhydrase family protein [Gammaproteobacteria bacterium]|nr:carbonic anhydrase family protein [Gammaproteobacteria bacterium]
MRRSRSFAMTLVAAGGLLTALAVLAQIRGSRYWAYNGETGPPYWGLMGEEFRACRDGKAQSPIDIRDASVHAANLPAIEFHYQPSKLTINDTTHTIEVTYAPGSYVTVGNERYELKQFHFHRPSEEQINGKSYAMAAHLVHESADGKVAVVTVFLTKGDAPSSLLKTLWDNVPKIRKVDTPVDAVTIDASKLLPASKAYYKYSGSLTTPPCTEGVTWFVLKSPTTVSAGEIDRFAKLYLRNARPVQPLNGREIDTGG